MSARVRAVEFKIRLVAAIRTRDVTSDIEYDIRLHAVADRARITCPGLGKKNIRSVEAVLEPADAILDERHIILDEIVRLVDLEPVYLHWKIAAVPGEVRTDLKRPDLRIDDRRHSVLTGAERRVRPARSHETDGVAVHYDRAPDVEGVRYRKISDRPQCRFAEPVNHATGGYDCRSNRRVRHAQCHVVVLATAILLALCTDEIRTVAVSPRDSFHAVRHHRVVKFDARRRQHRVARVDEDVFFGTCAKNVSGRPDVRVVLDRHDVAAGGNRVVGFALVEKTGMRLVEARASALHARNEVLLLQSVLVYLEPVHFHFHRLVERRT